jgi:hypothetical protein
MIKQIQKVLVLEKFKITYVKIWQNILLLIQMEPDLSVHSNEI